MKSPVICVILFFTRVCLLSVLGSSTLLKHILAYSCTVFSYIYFTLRGQTCNMRILCRFVNDVLQKSENIAEG